MKVGRNDPCPCGSGKKYKRCCAPLERGLANAGGASPGVGAALREAAQRQRRWSVDLIRLAPFGHRTTHTAGPAGRLALDGWGRAATL